MKVVFALLALAVIGGEAAAQRGVLQGRRVGGSSRPRSRAPSPDLAKLAAGKPQRPQERLPNCAAESCSPGFSAFKGKCYKIISSPQPIDFTASQRKCQQESSILASDTSAQVHHFLKGLLRPAMTEDIESRYRRAFIGLMCQDGCDSSSNWVYAEGSKCGGNPFCDWTQPSHEWNAVPTALHGASIAAILDDAPDTQYKNKLQPYPADHRLRFAVCQKPADSMEHQKPRNLKVTELLSSVELTWRKPACQGEVGNYIFLLLGGATTYDQEIRCGKEECSFELDPAACNNCLQPKQEYTFSVAPVMANAKPGPAVALKKRIDLETCPNFQTPIHTVSTCRGVSELIQDGSCEPKVTWSKGSMCGAVCEAGYGFFNEPAPKYSCEAGGQWSPAGAAPECYEIVPVFSANLQFKITYKQNSVESLIHQFDGLVYKYNDIFCPYPEECGIGDLQVKSTLDTDGAKLSEVIITIDTPVYNITDQTGFIDLVKEAVMTVNQDNAFMTLIDYDNIELLLPVEGKTYKAEPQLCCHSCPDGHAYRLGYCVLCPPGGPCENAVTAK